MFTWTDVGQCKSRMVHDLNDWWISNRDPGGIPDRRSFDPAGFKALMPNLVIVEIEPDPFRVRYRLVGTRVAQCTGFDFTGRYLDLFPVSAGGSDVRQFISVEDYFGASANSEQVLPAGQSTD